MLMQKSKRDCQGYASIGSTLREVGSVWRRFEKPPPARLSFSIHLFLHDNRLYTTHDKPPKPKTTEGNGIAVELAAETMSQSANFVAPGQARYLRACMVCSVVMTYSVSIP